MLTSEHIRALTAAYGELAEELRIFYVALKSEGFTPDESVDIITAMIARPDNLATVQERRRGLKHEAIRDFIHKQREREE